MAVLTIVQPAQATIYLDIQQAQALMFPGETLTEDFRTLSDAQVALIEKASDANVGNKQLRAWRSSTGGWFIADQVVGKHDFIPFAVALDDSGAVKDVEILEYREAYGSEVANPKWRAQFSGKNSQSPLRLTKDIQNISGATLSSKHITDGVRRLIVTHALVLAAR
jgi:Na+-translocating ferredoxin:NAD+ oxidoreductase RnfG subunit